MHPYLYSSIDQLLFQAKYSKTGKLTNSASLSVGIYYRLCSCSSIIRLDLFLRKRWYKSRQDNQANQIFVGSTASRSVRTHLVCRRQRKEK